MINPVCAKESNQYLAFSMIDANEIANELARDRSKANVSKLIGQIEKESMDFTNYFSVVEAQTEQRKWYMTWLLTHYVQQNPSVGNTLQGMIWEGINRFEQQGIQRDLWRAMTFIEIDDEISALVYDRALKVIRSVNNAIAVRAHAMLCACNIAMPYPELRKELSLILDEFKNDESSGLKSRARNLNKKLNGRTQQLRKHI